MSDLIRREDAIATIGVMYERCDTYDITDYRDLMLEAVKVLPSADRPQGEWIPCSKKLPANDDWVIISVLDEVGDTPYRYSDFGWYFERAKCWIVESEQRTDVVAWMPLPKPWKGADDGENIQSADE